MILAQRDRAVRREYEDLLDCGAVAGRAIPAAISRSELEFWPLIVEMYDAQIHHELQDVDERA